MAKKEAWGLRTRFNSLVALFITGVILLVISVSEKTGIWLENLIRCETSGGESTTSQCNLSSGRWVFDNESYPLYSERKCKYMFDELACEKYGRPDLGYQNWRWQPHECNLPRFNATALLERLRGKRLVFVGDSLNRGQWVSMVCLLESSIPSAYKFRHYKINGSLTTFEASEYNASVEFYWAPLLVESNSDNPVLHRIPDRIVRAESIIKHARHWSDADILVFNSYLWWKRAKMKIWWGSLDQNDGIYKEMEMLRAFEMALNTWSYWLEAHVDHNKTQIFFMSMSPTHQSGGEWGGNWEENCYNETEPITEGRYKHRASDDQMMKIITEKVDGLRERGIKAQIINITELSEYRKDGHPSIHRRQWTPLTEVQLSNPKSYADCVHWCLPGVPDAWNELLYAYIFSK